MKNFRIFVRSLVVGFVLVLLAVGAWQLVRGPAQPGDSRQPVQASAQPGSGEQAGAPAQDASPPGQASPTPLAQNAGEQPAATNTLRPPATARPMETSQYQIITVLPRDAIQAIDKPQFYGVAEADLEYAPEELVLGVSIGGESRAYSTVLLDRHEIVNDTVGGRKIAVTW